MGKYDEFINRLSALTGLHTDVLTAWVQREQGVNNNILGITSASARTPSNPHGLLSFPSQTAAANATAAILKSSPMYSGIIASASGSSQQQALAIAQSPWHLGPAGLRAAGGTDPYYYTGFVRAGILSGPTPTTQGGQTKADGGGGLNLNPVDAVTGAVNNAFGEVATALSTPLYFIGIVLIGITIMAIGGLIVLKPSAEKAAPLMAMAAK